MYVVGREGSRWKLVSGVIIEDTGLVSWVLIDLHSFLKSLPLVKRLSNPF